MNSMICVTSTHQFQPHFLINMLLFKLKKLLRRLQTSKLLDCKRSCRQLERPWRKSRSGYDRSKYRNYRNLCNCLMTEAKSQYFSNLIDENSENPRRLWDTINKILHRTPAAALPESNNVKSLCEHFAK